MHSYSNEFLVKISKPKISRRPMNVSLAYLAFFFTGRLAPSATGAYVCTEIDALIFWTIQLKILP